MTAIRIMSIIGIVLAGLSFLAICGTINTDAQAAAGWGVIVTLYLLALSIVGCALAKSPVRHDIPRP